MSGPSSARPRLALVRSSINVDETFVVPSIVRPGQTISSSSYTARAGGKGANVSAAIGLAFPGAVRFVGAVGKDASWPLDALKQRGVDVALASVLDDVPTGRAIIQVSAADAENSIVLLPGANATRSLDDAAHLLETAGPVSHLVLQNEISLETTRAFLRAAAGRGTGTRKKVATVFNPSPMLSASEAADFEWGCVDVLVVNEGEADVLLSLFGRPDAASGRSSVATELAGAGPLRAVSWILVTQGSRGVMLHVRQGLSGNVGEESLLIKQDAFKPKSVTDTTGAGDTFLGYLVAGLLKAETEPGHKLPTSQSEIQEILRVAVCAAAMAVEAKGALESIPAAQDVQARLTAH
ncbi:putative ribokinase [Tilletia horrida]|nr:putative ribokinase [Tilletia horrida]